MCGAVRLNTSTEDIHRAIACTTHAATSLGVRNDSVFFNEVCLGLPLLSPAGEVPKLFPGNPFFFSALPRTVAAKSMHAQGAEEGGILVPVYIYIHGSQSLDESTASLASSLSAGSPAALS